MSAFALLETVFGEYRVAWFALIEYALTCGVSAIVGVPRTTQERCQTLAVSVLVLYAVLLLAVGAIRPQTSRLGLVTAVASELFCFVNCVLLYVSLSREDQRIADIMRFVGLASYAVMWLQLAPAALVAEPFVRGAARVVCSVIARLASACARLFCLGAVDAKDGSLVSEAAVPIGLMLHDSSPERLDVQPDTPPPSTAEIFGTVGDSGLSDAQILSIVQLDALLSPRDCEDGPEDDVAAFTFTSLLLEDKSCRQRSKSMILGDFGAVSAARPKNVPDTPFNLDDLLAT